MLCEKHKSDTFLSMKNTSAAGTEKTAKAKSAKSIKSLSLIEKINKVKTLKSLNTLIEKASEFPCSNPATLRRRKRAIKAKLESLGVVNIRVTDRLTISTL